MAEPRPLTGPAPRDGGAPRLTALDHDGEVPGVAELDHDRATRRGYPEAVFCEGKSPAQLRAIAAALAQHHATAGTGRALPSTLFTRADEERAAAVLDVLPDAHHDREARLLAWPPTPPEPTGGLVVVACAGTSDLPVAREAELTARYLGRRTELVVDVGIAGLHRILGRVGTLRRAAAIVVVAGMDGALPGVVAGLVPAPVVAVPTSVGYGSSFEGLAALLTMLNSCAPGVGVVNIDNGYGGGHLAAQIAAPRTD
ncbi:MAG: nickel pincer cofactor biosynthesis protein LarB [Georgenia sp.]